MRILATVVNGTNKAGTVKLETTDGRNGVGKTRMHLKRGDKVIATVTLPYPRRIHHFDDIEKIEV